MYRFASFIRCLAERPRTPYIKVETLAELVNLHHYGVGKLNIRYFPDFPGAEYGTFIWLEEDRTSAYEEAFSDAEVCINSRYWNDRPHRRLIAAKEMMHVFDSREQQTDTAEKFRTLLDQIASSPLPEDASQPYAADREALWKATVALVPPWIRADCRARSMAGAVSTEQLAAELVLPARVVTAALSDLYEPALRRFGVEPF
jgi:hypothetical protein